MTVSSSPGTDATGSSDKTSQLERARAKSTKARQAFDHAQRKVDEIDGRLGRNAAKTSQDEATLRAAEAQVKQLKRALKDGSKERQRLLSDRKRATAAAEKAQEKVRSTESKYDRAVLADLIQREKQQDRQTAGAAGSSDGSPIAALPSAEAHAPIPLPAGPAGSGDSGGSAASDGSDGSDGSVEPQDLGTATARATAARSTAEAAGEGAEPAPTTPRARRPRRATAPRTTTSETSGAATPRSRRPRIPRGSAASASNGEATGSGADSDSSS